MKEKTLFPVKVDLTDSHVLVICAGDVRDGGAACALIRALHRCTEHLRILSPAPCARVRQEAAVCHAPLDEKPYAREDLFGADVVISTLDDAAVNDDIFAACRTLGIRLCILAQPQRSDFIPDFVMSEERGSCELTEQSVHPGWGKRNF